MFLAADGEYQSKNNYKKLRTINLAIYILMLICHAVSVKAAAIYSMKQITIIDTISALYCNIIIINKILCLTFKILKYLLM